jgi:hypothetical protein
MNDPRGFPGFSIGRRRLLTYAVSSPVMPIVTGFGVNLATPSSAVAADPQIRWSAHMESGTLLTTDTPPGEWDEQVNDLGCTTVAIGTDGAVRPHGGNWMMKQTVPAQGGGTRMQRYPEVDALSRSQTTYYYSFWHYLPSAISYGIYDTYIVWGLNSSRAAGVAGDPFWALVLASSSGTGALDLIWNPTDSALGAGPHALSPGNKYTFAGLAANRLPIGRWNFIEIMISPSWPFEGQIAVWQNGTLIHEWLRTDPRGGVKTQWPISNPPQNLLAWFMQAGYGSGLTPTPTINYVDDVTVSLGRIPPIILWSAGMEMGTLLLTDSPAGEWSDKVNTGAADSTAVRAAAEGIPPHGGQWVMKQAVTGAAGGTRMARYPEITQRVQAGGDFWVSWYDFYPRQITYGIFDMFSFWQIAGVDASLSYNPVWTLNFDGASFCPVLIWSPNGMAPDPGPHEGEAGKRFYTSSTPIPVGRWVRFDMYIKPAADFTGAFTLWMDGVKLFDLSAIKTSYPGVGNPGQPGFFYMTHNAYGSGLTPTPATHYVDDVTYSLGRMP